MGLMSTALHQQYRITVTVETVVLSGFFDSIGVYRQAKVMATRPYARVAGVSRYVGNERGGFPAVVVWAAAHVTHRPCTG